MELAQWLLDVEVQLQKLRKRELKHENIIPPPGKPELLDKLNDAVKKPIPRQIVEFYTYCGGMELGDIHNGYWIDSVSMILLGMERNVPTKVSGPEGVYNILVFGQDGGGNYLASRLDGSDEILYLPTGIVEDSVFDGVWTPVIHLADDFYGVLERLLKDIEAYVEGTPDHNFMN